MACRGPKIRNLAMELPSGFHAPSLKSASVIQSGILGLTIQPFTTQVQAEAEIQELCNALESQDLSGFPLIILSDDSVFTAASINNFVWVTFTRSNPSHDIYGIHSFIRYKHWGCKGSLIIDARKKPHHAPELVTDENIRKSVAQWLTF
jgi:4-hydroxy-3-polyprenylbenzoate decarboxylase